MTQIDIIVPCYNYGAMLDACAGSVLSQEGVEVRLLIVDDASTDNTEEVGRRLAAGDARVEYWRHSVNRGHIATYNEALAWVSGRYCVILSADDLLTPRALLRATRVMDAHPQVGLAYGADITFRQTPQSEGRPFPPLCSHRIIGYGAFLEHACRLGHTGIQSPTAVVRTSLHKMIGGYLPELPHSGDTEIWLRMAAHADVAELRAEQAFRRLHANNMSLNYSLLARLEEQKRAFDVHFAQYRDQRPEIGPLEPVMNRTIAEAAFWSGARAFEDGGRDASDALLAFATTIHPPVQASPAWRRLQWKRRLGYAAWRRMQPLAAGFRTAAAGVRLRLGARHAVTE